MTSEQRLLYQIDLERNRYIARYVTIFGLPFFAYWMFSHFTHQRIILGCFVLALFSMLILNVVLSRRFKLTRLESAYYSIFFMIFFGSVSVFIIYMLGIQGDSSRLPWFYLFFFLMFPTLGHRKGTVLMGFVIVALPIVWHYIPGVQTVDSSEIRPRLIASASLVLLIFFLIEKKRIANQGELINQQVSLEQTDQELREALEHIKRENEHKKQVEKELRSYKDQLVTIVKKRTRELEETNYKLQSEVNDRRQIQYDQKRLISIIEHSSDFIASTSLDWEILFLNQAGKQLIGIDEKNAAVYQPDRNFYIRDFIDSAQFDDEMVAAVHHHGFWKGESQFKNLSTGEWIPMDVTIFPLMNSVTNLPSGYATVSRDITQKLEEQRHRETLEAQLRQSQKMEAIGTLAGGIAHDFNNILGTIMGYTEMALDTLPQDSDVRSHLEESYQAGDRATELVSQLLTISRTENPELQPVQITRLLRKAIKLIRATSPTTIEIKTDFLENDDLTILGSETQIHQVMLNLCNNAIYEIGENGGTIRISTKVVHYPDSAPLALTPHQNEYLNVTIHDTGPGIPESIADKIFDPFFTTKEIGEGTGLGLSIVHRIMKIHNGAVMLDTSVTSGTTFQLFFPLAECYYCSSESEENQNHKGSERILVVEDEVKLGAMYKKYLSLRGYRVTVAGDGSEALELFSQFPDRFDLIFTDQTMPKLTGFEMSKAMLKIRPSIPIILSTGYDSNLTEEVVLSTGIKRFIMKPVRMSELNTIIRNMMTPPNPLE